MIMLGFGLVMFVLGKRGNEDEGVVLPFLSKSKSIVILEQA